jgi:hypothetical protein
MDRVFKKIATGLLYYRYGRLPPDARVIARVINPDPFQKLSERLIRGGLPVQRLGAEAWWVNACDPQGDGLMLFMLHGSTGVGVWMGIATRPPQGREIPPARGVAIRE